MPFSYFHFGLNIPVSTYEPNIFMWYFYIAQQQQQQHGNNNTRQPLEEKVKEEGTQRERDRER